ncbi:hypothetical protein VTN31DRAFT_4769 [Thermomyces dupontii]|uniref:uncharacterized protein n=1 Tax=Talaromyces thermophilus TaxID=28565 RepID=UPI0037425A90
MPQSSDHGSSSPAIHTLRSFELFPAGSSLEFLQASSYQSYHDFRDAILVPPTTLTAHHTPKDSTWEPIKSVSRWSSTHRRANTELSHTQTRFGHAAINSFQRQQFSTRKKMDLSKRLLPDSLQGGSDPASLEMVPSPTRESSHSEMDSSVSNGTPMWPEARSQTSRLQKRMTAPSTLRSWFGPTKEAGRPEIPEPADDELLNLDVASALFPTAASRECSAESFKLLQSNAENILRRLQAAYKQRTFALHEAMAEKAELQEELAESRSRIQNIKMQLDGMAQRVQEQEEANKALTEELRLERKRRQEVEAARSGPQQPSDNVDDSIASATPKRHEKRCSASTITTDSGFESGDESYAESVFSRRPECPGSPVSSVSLAPAPSATEITLTPAIDSASARSPSPSQSSSKTATPPTPQPSQRLSAYDRIVRGLTPFTSTFSGGTSKCSNCHGVRPSEAWSVVGVLKDENKGLKERIGELESVIDDCLGLVT